MYLSALRNIFGRARRVETGFDAALAEAVTAGSTTPDIRAPEPQPLWTPQRVALVGGLWGEGFVGPCGADEVLRLVAPLGLSAASTLLLLGAGAGGPALAVAAALGAWVAGHETDPCLVAEATRRLAAAGAAMAKRATVQSWTPPGPQFRPHGIHGALAIEAIDDAALAEPVIAGVKRAMQPGGQFVLLETVADAALDPGDPTIAAWCRLERRRPDLPSEVAVTTALTRHGFEVRVVEDQSMRHVKLVVLGWERLTRALLTTRPSPSVAALLVIEAELWTRRLRLMQAGRIRLVRWHAIAAPQGA